MENAASSLLRILQRLSIEPGVQTKLYVKQAEQKATQEILDKRKRHCTTSKEDEKMAEEEN